MPRLAHPLIRCWLVVAVFAALAAMPAGAATFLGDPVVGPTPALHTLGGLDLAPDGTGAITYTLDDGGVPHVFVSRLVNGAWSGPERVDGGLGDASSQPVVSAAGGGRVVVAFVNDGNVYAVTRPSAGAGYSRQTLWGGGGASSPALDLSVNGKQYLAFAAPGAGGHDVRVAFARDGGSWSLVGAPLDGNPAADAGSGTARPQVAASADGTAVVVWGEGGHVLARRVRGTQPSVVFADASDGLTLEGVPATSADAPVVGMEDDDSFAGVAFHAIFDVGGTLRSRVVFRRLRGSRFEGPSAVDTLSFGAAEGSDDPRIATVGTGQGIVLGTGDTTFLSAAMLLHADIGPNSATQVDSIARSFAPTFAVPAAATALKMVVAWQLTPDGGTPAIHARYYNGTDFESEQVLSRSDLGPTSAADGLAAAGDDEGDLAIAYVQDVPGQGPAIAVATIDQPPGRFAANRMAGFQRTDRPVLAWTTSREAWGRYFKVAVDGTQVAVTGRRSLRVPSALAQGAHTWQVTALDRRGQQYIAPAHALLIDSLPAIVQARVTGRPYVGTSLRLTVRASDTPPGLAAGAQRIKTSGVKQILVDWGDRTPRELIRAGTRHAFAHPGRYALRILVLDGAGNRTTVRQLLKIVKPPKPKKKAKHGHAHGRHPAAGGATAASAR